MRNTYVQFYRYIVVGGSAAVLNISIYNILITISSMNYEIAGFIGYMTGFLLNFTFSKKWVFKNTSEKYVHQVAVFLTIALIGLFINNSVLYIFVHHFGINKSIAYFIATGVAFLWNFSAHKLITFNYNLFKNKVEI